MERLKKLGIIPVNTDILYSLYSDLNNPDKKLSELERKGLIIRQCAEVGRKKGELGLLLNFGKKLKIRRKAFDNSRKKMFCKHANNTDIKI
ncbi:hypothetical protein AGMMS49982_22120 [Bacteroidia bacterium]|nr:hypothetical protein AGMMS49982_22120 [Bacteroidia bacterium]